MKNRWKQISLRTFMAVVMAVAVSFQSFAASARIAFSDPSAEVGSQVNVTMKFTSTSGDVLGNTDVMLAYDSSMLEFVTGSENVSGGSGALRVTSGMEGKTEIVTSLTFRALAAGSTQITVSSWEGYDSDGQTLTLDRQGSSAVTITAPATYSTDAALQSLQVSPGTLEPAFSPDVENYSVAVGLDTERLTVSAVPNSDRAAVAVEGGSELLEGENTVVCRVTAEDGTTVRSYTILVNKTEGGASLGTEETGADIPSDLEVLVELEASKSPLKIGIAALPEGVAAPAGLKESTITIGETRVQGWIPQAEGQPEYCVFYGVSESGVPGFYCYDRADRTLQRYFAGAAVEEISPELIGVAEKYNELADDYNLVRWAAILAFALAAVLLIVLIVVLRKAGGGKGRNGSSAPQSARAERRQSRAVGGRKLSKEERYMLGEEEEYEEEHFEPAPVMVPGQAVPSVEADYLENEDDVAEERRYPSEETDYLPEAADYLPEEAVLSPRIPAAAEPVERAIAESLAKAAAAAVDEPAAVREPLDEEDDFEVFDLDDEEEW